MRVFFVFIDAHDFFMNDFIQIMPPSSGQAIMLGCLTTEPVESEYVNGLLQEVKVLLTEAMGGPRRVAIPTTGSNGLLSLRNTALFLFRHMSTQPPLRLLLSLSIGQ